MSLSLLWLGTPGWALAPGAALALMWMVLKLVAVAAGPTPPRPRKPYFDGPHPLVIAHRGDSAHFPENTLPAFRRAAELGARMIETDVWLTRERIPVTCHDPTVDRTTGGRGRIPDLDLAGFGGFDAGYAFSADGGRTFPHRGQGIRIPTLEEVFAALPGIRINIDIKDPSPDAADAVMALVRALGREEETLLVSLHPAVQARLAEAWAPHPRSEDDRAVARLWFLDLLGLGDLWRPSADALQIPPSVGAIPVASRRLLAAARRHAIPVHVWTLNRPEEWDRYLERGVEGIMTDDPGGLREHLRRRGRTPLT